MLALLLLLVAAPPAPDGEAVAGKLARAEAAAAALDLDIARDVLLDVVTDARSTEQELARAHLLAGEVDRILGKDVDARMHFLWVLQRDPEAQLPPGKPPKITAFFELVRAEARGRDDARAPSPSATPATPTPTPTTPSAGPAASAPPEVAPMEGAPLPLSAVVAGVGAAGAVAGLALAVVGESGFAKTDAPWIERSDAQVTAVLGWSFAALSTVVAGAGLVLWSTAP